jgi:hypothetical protein
MSKENAAEEHLRSAGWIPDRRVRIDQALECYRPAGYSVFAGLADFLVEYSDLWMLIDHVGRTDEIWIAPCRACTLIDRSWVIEYGRRSSTSLVPIGGAYRNHLVLLLGGDGRIFGGYDNEFGVLGNNAKDVIANLVDNRGFIERM